MNMHTGTQDDNYDPMPPSDELRAGEYVLGVLDAQARRDVQSRMTTDPAFTGMVHAWEERLAPLLDEATTAQPAPHVWPRIRTQLGWAPVEGARPTGVWNSAAFWRTTTVLAMAASVAAIVIGLQQRQALSPAPAPVAVQAPATEEQAAKPVTVLAGADGATAWIATINAARDKVLMVPVPRPLDASGRVDELWIIPAGQAPVSLGFVSNEKAHTIAIPAAIRRAVAIGATLAITLEPQAGMPHAAPSGPVVAKGDIRQI
jgi:anti-sigma-K factor RskA